MSRVAFFFFFFLVLSFVIFTFSFFYPLLLVFFGIFLLLSLVYTFLRIALSPAMNEDHECHDRVRPKVFLLFCFHFVGTWHPPRNRPTIQVRTGPWERVCRLSYPWTLTFFVVVDAYLLAGENGVGRDICESVLFIPGFMLYISIVFNSKTWIFIFSYLIID